MKGSQNIDRKKERRKEIGATMPYAYIRHVICRSEIFLHNYMYKYGGEVTRKEYIEEGCGCGRENSIHLHPQTSPIVRSVTDSSTGIPIGFLRILDPIGSVIAFSHLGRLVFQVLFFLILRM
jgi:hypothetical protein